MSVRPGLPRRVRHASLVTGWLIALPMSACHLVLSDVNPADDFPNVSGGTSGNGGSSGSTAIAGGGASGSGCNGTVGFFCDGANLINCADRSVTPCPSSNLCRALDNPPRCLVCVKDDTACEGNVRVRCNAEQTAWVPIETCSGATPVCDETLKECTVCARGASRCVDLVFEECDTSTRMAWVHQRTCETAGGLSGCVKVDATHAHCEDCRESTFVPVCSGANELSTCDVYQVVPTECPNGCIGASGAVTAHCR